MRQTVDKFNAQAREIVERLSKQEKYAGAAALFESLMNADQSNQGGIEQQRARVEELKKLLAADKSADAVDLASFADYLVRKAVFGVGGDGWGYDIGYGGVDQVMASGQNVNLLILDTEVYSNTGGQMSKSTPLGAVAQFAAAGKHMPKKNIASMMIPYGHVYVAHVAFAANPAQTVRAFQEAEAFDGPSLIVAYSHCIGQGIDDMSLGLEEQKKAVASGHWPLFRYNPMLEDEGKNPVTLDCQDPSIPYAEFLYRENRFKSLKRSNPTVAAELLKQAEEAVMRRWNYLKHLAAWSPKG